jgi:predicted nucleic acid-binding protein
MKRVFGDAFFFLALLSERDAAHRKARHVCSEQPLQIVTRQWVLTEVADGMARSDYRQQFISFARQLPDASHLEIIPANAEIFARGLERYCQRPDKQWSLTDCISFLAMEDEGLTEALMGDHHFEQAGFTILLK